tara:strand:- start:946 stop:1089 length:144 start_codon:yes stop_codon:yes gene_type:complete
MRVSMKIIQAPHDFIEVDGRIWFLGHPIRVTHVICDVGRKAQKTWQV